MNPLEIQFSANPFAFQLVGHLLIAAFSLWILLRKRPLSDGVFIVILVAFTAFMRLPAFLFNHELDPDESQMLTQGLTLSIDPVVYRSIDPTTGGPLTSYLLSGFAYLGFTLDFQFAHILSWVLTIAALIISYFTAKVLNLAATVQWAILPFISFLSCIQFTDFVSFYSEIVSILVLSVTVFFLAYWNQKKGFEATELVIFGILLGTIPLCKLQALPMAFVVGVYACAQLFFYQRSKLISHFLYLTLGFVGWWSIWCLFLANNDVLDDFYTYYIEANLAYKDNFATNGVPRSKFVNFFRLPWVIVRKGCGFEWLLYPFMLLSMMASFVIIIKKRAGKSISLDAYFWVMLVGYLLMANLAITRTGSYYEHYFHYLFLPFLLFFSLFLKHLPSQSRWVMVSTQAAFFVLFVINIVRNKPTNMFASTPRSGDVIRANIAHQILEYGAPGQYMAVWGWSCDLYVTTQMPQGVNENHTTRSGMHHSYQKRYYQRYLRDLQRNQPAIFVDAVTPRTIWMDNQKKYGHHNYPELADFIAKNYLFRAEVEGVKIYSHK